MPDTLRMAGALDSTHTVDLPIASLSVSGTRPAAGSNVHAFVVDGFAGGTIKELRATLDGWAKRDGVLENFLPRNAAAGIVNTAGVAWTWSAYGQIVASVATPFVPHGVHLLVRGQMLLGGVLVGVNLEYEIATGAAGSEQTFFRYVDALAGNINLGWRPHPGLRASPAPGPPR